jgi:hypothetical protein
VPSTHAPQSQAASDVHARRSHWCSLSEPTLQSVLTGHLNVPPTQEIGAHPFAVALLLGLHSVSAGHLNVPPTQEIGAHPFAVALLPGLHS